MHPMHHTFLCAVLMNASSYLLSIQFSLHIIKSNEWCDNPWAFRILIGLRSTWALKKAEKKEIDGDREGGGWEFERHTIAVKKSVGRLLAPRKGDFVTGPAFFPSAMKRNPPPSPLHTFCVYSSFVVTPPHTLCEAEVGNLKRGREKERKIY